LTVSKRIALFLGVALAWIGVPVHAAYPDKPIKVVVPFVAGGITDAGARVLLDHMSQRLGVPVLVENRPGAGTKLGTRAVVAAPNDGYTLLMTNSNLTMVPAVESSPGYDAQRDLAPIGLASDYGVAIVVKIALPVRTLHELVQYAKRNPGRLSYGSAGVGSGTQLMAEHFKHLTGTDIVHVPYRSTALAIQDVAAGTLDLTFDGAARPYADAGRVRVIAVTNPQRDPRFPDVPTVGEQGLPAMTLVSYLGLFAPRGTSPAVVERLNRALNLAATDAGVRSRLAELGMTPRGGSPAEMVRRVSAELAYYRRVVEAAGLKFE